MMSGRLLIDGQDVYSRYGVYVADNGWGSLVAMPALKTVDSNDWMEEDGVEADLSAPVLNTRDVDLTFAAHDFHNRYFDFLSLLEDGAYHEFHCAVIRRTYRLRMVSHTNLDYAKLFGKVKVRFADDFPLKGYEYKAPTSGMKRQERYYALDGRHFSEYGIMILSGTVAEMLKPAEVKQNLLRNPKAQTGVVYDGENVVYKSKDVKIYCLMRAESLDELWRNYDALLYDLVRPDERVIWVNELRQEFVCYYKSCAVQEFSPEGRPWLKFTLTVTFTGDLRVSENFLAAEDGAWVTVENGEDRIMVQLKKEQYGWKN